MTSEAHLRVAARARERLGGERFEIVRALGAGGHGVVFEARDRATGGRVALKVLHEQTAVALLRFKQEFRALSELSHPNVVRFGGLFEEGGQFYFTMELVEGQALLDYVRAGPNGGRRASRNQESRTTESPASGVRGTHGGVVQAHDGRLDVGRLRDVLAQLAGGLIALHAAGLVHRDIKPENVLITSAGRAVLLDFGLALSLDDAHTSEFAGTFSYMAPEQAMGQEVQPAADWYAFGAVLHEALTGQPPHSRRGMRSFWTEAREKLPSPREQCPELPDDLCQLCMELLEFSPERRPTEASIAERLGIQVARARDRASFRSRVHFARGVFLGRERECEALRLALRRAEQGESPLVWVDGESGIGKSALLRHVLGGVYRERSATVLASRCYEREAVPYRGMDGIIDALVRELEAVARLSGAMPLPPDADFLAELFPVLRAVPGFDGLRRPEQFDVDPHEARRKAFVALRNTLAYVAEQRPVVIHLDDAQWMDAESVALLTALLHEQMPRVLVILSSRPTPGAPSSALLDGAGALSFVRLEPLSGEESEALVSALLPSHARDGVDTARVAITSGGHPLFIHELVMHVSSHEELVPSLDAAVANRLRGLDSSSRLLLERVALAAAPLKHNVAQLAGALSAEDYPWVLSTLRSENLLTFRSLSENGDVQVYHDRIRELIVASMDRHARCSAHRALAGAIEQHAPDELDALAHHYAGAGESTRAARYARAAGERSLQKLAFENATELFRLALRFEESEQERAALEALLGTALANCGRGREAAQAYLRAAELTKDVESVELRRRAGEQLLRAGHVGRGTEILFSMLRQLGMRVPVTDVAILVSLIWALLRLSLRGLRPSTSRAVSPRERLRLDVCWTVATGLSVVHHLRASEFQARALLLALDAGDKARIVKGAALLGVGLGMADGALTRKLAERLRARAVELAREEPSDETQAWLQLTDGVACLGNWNFAECERLCSQAEATLSTRCAGAAWELVTAQAFSLWSATFRGCFNEARARLPQLLLSARARGDRHAETTLFLSPVHLLGLSSDTPGRVREESQRRLAEWPSSLACFQHMCGAYVLAHVDLYEGQLQTAWKHVATAWKMLRRGHLSRVQFQRIDLLGLRGRAALAQAACTAGHSRSDWLRRVRSDVRRLRAERVTAAAALADMVEGGAHHLSGNRDAACACLRKAVEGYRKLSMLLHAACVEVALASLSRDEHRLVSAQRELRELGVVNVDRMVALWVPGVDVWCPE